MKVKAAAAIALALILPGCALFDQERHALRNAGTPPPVLTDPELEQLIRTGKPTFRP